MAYIVNDQLEVSIFIDSEEYWLQDTNILNYIHLGCDVKLRLPALQFSIIDMTGTLESGLQDGIPIAITLRPKANNSITWNFRKFHHTKTLDSSGRYQYVIDAYLDAPLYFMGTTTACLQGTSSSVLAQIASNCGLLTDIDKTSDSQIWVPQNKSWSMFAKYIADHGYVNAQSCMCLAVDLDSTLRYKNLEALKDSTKRILAYQYDPGAFTAVDMKTTAVSGLANIVSGYWNLRVAQNSTESVVTSYHDSLTFASDSKAPLLNTKVKDLAQSGPVRFSHIDTGNLHENFELANYQNIRYRNLYSSSLEILLATPSNIQLFDRVNFTLQTSTGANDDSTSGLYTVTGRAIYIQGLTFAERINMTRHGTNDQFITG